MKPFLMPGEIIRTCPPNMHLDSGTIIAVRHGKDGSQRAGVTGENPVQRAFLRVKKWRGHKIGWSKPRRIPRDDVLGIIAKEAAR